jgi:hypothetical protein
MPAAAQDAVGRLFFTPSQRASLDVARTQRARTGLAGETEEQAAPAAQTLRYGGMVRRSDGKSTVWINNRAVNDNETAGSAVVGRVRPDGGITLQIPQTGRNVTLKPGQSRTAFRNGGGTLNTRRGRGCGFANARSEKADRVYPDGEHCKVERGRCETRPARSRRRPTRAVKGGAHAGIAGSGKRQAKTAAGGTWLCPAAFDVLPLRSRNHKYTTRTAIRVGRYPSARAGGPYHRLAGARNRRNSIGIHLGHTGEDFH